MLQLINAIIQFRFFGLSGLYLLTIWGSMLLAYQRNERLPIGSPDKREYHPLAILIAPFTLPFIIVIGATVYVLWILVRSIAFGLVILILPFVLIFFRKLDLIERFLKVVEKLGRALLKVNTLLLRMLGFSPPQALPA